MRLLKRAGKILLLCVICILAVIAAWIIVEENRDPLSAIDKVSLNAKLIRSEQSTDSLIAGRRLYREIELYSEETDTIRAVISFPAGYEGRKLPVVTILGGLEIGKENFRLIRDPGDNILIIYMYPYSPDYWYEGNALHEIGRIRDAVFSVPAQVIDLLVWAKKQEWADASRMPVLGYSFGALFLPSVFHLANENEVLTGPGILAYGGTDLRLLLETNLKLKPEWLRPPVAWLAAMAVRPLDPKYHAAHMKGNFYLINGLKDKQIPQDSWRELHRLIAEPKEISILDEGHMHPKKPELTQRLVDMSRQWLRSRDMLNR